MHYSIIGGNGFLAKHIIKFYEQENAHIVLYGRTNGNDKKNEFIKTDLLIDTIDVQQLMLSDVIFYTAAIGVQSTNSVQTDELYLINVYKPIEIMQKLNKDGYKGKFISFGSYFEVGNTNDLNFEYDEKAVVYARNAVPNDYCLSKRLLTRYFNDCSLSFNWYHCILPTIYGIGESNLRLIPYVVNAIIDGSPISLSKGIQTRQYLNVNDAINIVDFLIKKDIPRGIYNFPACETLTIKEIVQLIYKSFNKPIDHSIFGKLERKDESMLSLKLNANKINSYLSAFDFTLTSLNDYITKTNFSKWN